MLKHLFSYSSVLCFLLVMACSPKVSSPTGSTSTNMGKDVTTPAGQRKFIDPANMNLAVRPQDDFYQYVNAKWKAANPIPANESRWGTFIKIRYETDQKLRAIFADLEKLSRVVKGSNERLVRDFYRSGMDMKKRNTTFSRESKERQDAILFLT